MLERLTETNDANSGVVLVMIVSIMTSASACAISQDTPDSTERFPRPFMVIAHRGASAYAPENTLPAFQKALDLGAFEVELDVMLTRDREVLLFHDQDLEIKTGLAGRVSDYQLSQLRELEIGSWFDRTHPEIVETGVSYNGTSLITLEELFDHFGGRLYYHIELKSSEEDLAALTLGVVEKAGLREHVRITSFNYSQLLQVTKLDADIPTCLLIRGPERLAESAEDGKTDALTLQMRWVERAKRAGFGQVGIHSRHLSLEIVHYTRRLGLLLRSFGIKGNEDMIRAIDLGAGGMTTNWPDRLIREMVRQAGSKSGSPGGNRQYKLRNFQVR